MIAKANRNKQGSATGDGSGLSEEAQKLLDELVAELGEWQALADEEYKNVIDELYNPLIPTRPTLEPILPESNTAFFDFTNNQTSMSLEFLLNLHNKGGIDKRTAVRGVAKHEIGHYVHYPKECAKLMFLKHFAEGCFKEHKEAVVAYWVDIMDNIRPVLTKEMGRDVRQLYKAMNKLIEEEMVVPEPMKKSLKAQGYDIDKAMDSIKRYNVDRLLTAYYQIQGGEDLGVTVDMDYMKRYQEHMKARQKGKTKEQWETDPEHYMEEKLAELMTLDLTNPANEMINFVQFGTIISEVMSKLKEELPPPPKGSGKGCSGKGKGKSRKGKGSSGSGSDEPGEAGEPQDGAGSYEEFLDRVFKPIMGDAPSLGDFRDDQIQEGLDKIIREWGKHRYEKIKEYVEKETGKKFDAPGPQKKGKGIGLGKSQLDLNDEQIPYFIRFASTFGCYIYKRPIVTDVTSNFREGQTRYKTSDPFKVLNPFSTGGQIMPSITRAYRLKAGTKQDRLYKVPDLYLWLDSSGSMTHPKNGSKAVIASFILAMNYWENGARVGVANFSAETAFLWPTRDIDQVYSMLCAYWGGGTVLNVEKIKEYVQRLSQGDSPMMPIYTTEEDYERLIESMHPDERKEYLDKQVNIDLSGKVKETYEKMDNILITDGGIFNLGEVIEYINSLSQVTRNAVFLIDNANQYEEWQKMTLNNTMIHNVAKPEDLYGLSIGAVKTIAPPKDKPRSLFS